MKPVEAINQIARLYELYGHLNYDEVMSQVQHAVQAGRLAKEHGYSDEVILGAFLHDIGHLMVEEVPESQRDEAVYKHQITGANFLRELGFSEMVALIVDNHVAGKRYLTAVNPDYAETLSSASVESLKFQGGPMSPEEVKAFETDANKDIYIEMRHWDDQAKDPDDADLNMQPYFDIALKHLNAQGN
ncbi:MAG: HDIG domain-containing protein [Neptuniibacter sp.]